MEKIRQGLMEQAMATTDIWVYGELNRGWVEDLKTGKKVRMKKDEYEQRIAKQQEIEEEINAALELQQEQEADEAEAHQAEVDATEELKNDDNMTARLFEHIAEQVMFGKGAPKTVTIICANDHCKAERVIKVQDQFQVKFCPDCQREHRNARRRQLRAEKKAAAEAAKQAAESQE